MPTKINPNILALDPYIPGKPVEEIQARYGLEKVVKLASNENPFPPPAPVQEAIRAEMDHINWYPDSDSHYLREDLARVNGISKENIILGSGSVEIIRMIVRGFLQPGETVLTSRKTFIMFRIAAIEQGGRGALVEAEMGDDHVISLHHMKAALDDTTRIIFIANPNNPTGTLLPRTALLEFIDFVSDDVLIVLDNAYHEYVDPSESYLDGIELAVTRKNILVLRTFSKIYSLAGLRIGYGIGHAETIATLNRIKAPFNITRIAQKAAMAALKCEDFKNHSVEVNRTNRRLLLNRLKALDLKVVPSHTNFLLFYPGTDIQALNEALLRQGIIVRPLAAFGIPDGMRVTVGTEEDIDDFMQALEKAL